jgi:hypothetical protein
MKGEETSTSKIEMKEKAPRRERSEENSWITLWGNITFS